MHMLSHTVFIGIVYVRARNLMSVCVSVCNHVCMFHYALHNYVY